MNSLDLLLSIIGTVAFLVAISDSYEKRLGNRTQKLRTSSISIGAEICPACVGIVYRNCRLLLNSSLICVMN